MKKATPVKVHTSKSLLQKRVRGSKFLKIPADREQYVEEDLKPRVDIKIPKHSFHPRDRKLKDEDPRNPFDMPEHMRLFVFSDYKRKPQKEPFIMSDPHTICDVDDTFYKVIEGRPLRAPGDVKIYMKNIRDITLCKANAAYLIDQLIQIDTDLADEVAEYDKVNDLFAKCKNNFVQFAKESYETAKVTQMIAEEGAQALAKVSESLEAYNFEFLKLRNQVSATAAVFEVLAKYRKFLNSISPKKWRELYDKYPAEGKRVSLAISTDEVTEPPEKSLEFYQNCVQQIQKYQPILYFRDPEELMHLYEDLSAQCLNYMQVDVIANSLVSSVLKNRNELKAEVLADVAEVAEIVDDFKAHVEFMEEKEQDYKVLFDSLLINKFQDLCSSEDAIKLFTYVQYTYKQLFGGSEDPKDNIVTVMLQLEMHYLELTLGLDSLDQGIVKQAVNELFAEDIKVMKRAYNAQRSMRECDILKKALYTSFEPSRATRK